MPNILSEWFPVKAWRDTADQYSAPWDPIGELIQNSVVNLRKTMSDEMFLQKLSSLKLDSSLDSPAPMLKVHVDSKNKFFTVFDKGTGFQSIEFLYHAGGGVKGIEESGYGLGLCATLARSDKFRLITRRFPKSEIEHITINGARKCLDEQAIIEEKGGKCDLSLFDVEFEPFVEGNWEGKTQFPENETFTLIEVGFDEDDSINSSEKDYSLSIMWDWIKKYSLKSFTMAVMFHTALGDSTKLHSGKNNREIYWEYSTDKDKSVNQQLGDIWQEPRHKELFWVSDTKNKEKKATPSHWLAYKFSGSEGKKFGHVKLSIRMYCSNKKGGRKDLEENYSKFLTYRDVIEKGQAKTKTPLAFISINGVPQPFRYEFQTTSNRTVDNFTIIFIDAKKDIVEKGRRSVQDVYKDFIDRKINEALSKINTQYNNANEASKKNAGKSSQQKKGVGGKKKKAKGSMKFKPKVSVPKKTQQTLEIFIGETEEDKIRIDSWDSILDRFPVKETALNYLFIEMILQRMLPPMKIMEVGDNVTDLDFTIKPLWKFDELGEFHKTAVKKDLGSKTDLETLGSISEIEAFATMTVESKPELKKLIGDIEDGKKKDSDIDFVICRDTKVAGTGWNIVEISAEQAFHSTVTHLLYKETAPGRSIQVWDLTQFFDYPDETDAS